MTREEIFRKLYKEYKAAQDYMSKVPSDISTFMVTNDYAESYHKMVEMLIPAYFGKHAEAIEWFIYDWEVGYKVSANIGDRTIILTINNIDEYIKYLKKYEDF